ncbi:MAG: GntR family transcriptional regulator [Sphingomonas bacterium]|nr:GntR family transcriptional regulator [Sphingomonas bacterium]
MENRLNFGRFSEGTLSSHDQVARALGIEILAGTYPPGTKLPPEAEMLSRFGISRTVLREAFKTLTAKGLIVAKTRVGTTVLDSAHWNFFDADILEWKVSQGFDLAFVRDLADIRRAIEAAGAQAAAARRSSDDIAEMRRCLDLMNAATDSASAFALADLEFHKAIGRASGNVLIRSLAAVIETALLASFRMSSPVREADEHAASVAGHRRIVDAIEAGDGEAAAEAMRVIIGHGVARIERNKSSRKREKG